MIQIQKNIASWLIIGFLTAYLSMTVEANILRKEMPDEETYWKINFGQQYLQNPLIYSIIAVVVFYLVTTFVPKQWQQYWLVGSIMGIIIPSIKMIDNYAVDVYEVTPQFLFAWDLMIYTLFYLLIITPLMYFLYK